METVSYLGWKAAYIGGRVLIQTPTTFEQVAVSTLPRRIRALLRNRAVLPAILLGILASEIEDARMVPTAADRTFVGCRDALQSLVLAWNRVFRPMLIPRVDPQALPQAFGGEGATMQVLGTPVTLYYPANGGGARIRAAGEEIAVPRDIRAALAIVVVAAGQSVVASASCDCGGLRG